MCVSGRTSCAHIKVLGPCVIHLRDLLPALWAAYNLTRIVLILREQDRYMLICFVHPPWQLLQCGVEALEAEYILAVRVHYHTVWVPFNPFGLAASELIVKA